MADLPASDPLSLARLPRAAQWGLLLAGSLILIGLLELVHLPAALFLGPMIMAIAMGVGEAEVRVPQPLFLVAQAVVGLLMARALPASTFVELVHDWPLYVTGILSVIVVAATLGIVLTRLKVLPGTTAIWGSAPGAATAMILMADSFGADARLVAFMTYLRVVLVAVAASVVSRLFVVGNAEVAAAPWFPPVAAIPFAETIAIVVVALVVARLIKVPAGALILPMALGVLLQDVAGLQIELPPVLLAVSYALVGWTVGLRFTRDILVHAARAFPAILGSMLALIAICGGFAMLLVWLAGIDPLTAYLATSPGGADSVAIIAANSKVDMPFVMAMQAGRFIVVLFTGPALARFIARHSGVKD
jgi:membrane AbrB-like protein